MWKIGIGQPNTSENEKRKTSADFVIRHIRQFINDECWGHYNRWLDEASGKVRITLSRVQDEIQRIENKGSRYRINRGKRLPDDLTVNETFSTNEDKAEINYTRGRRFSKSPDRRQRRYSGSRDGRRKKDDRKGKGQKYNNKGKMPSRSPSVGLS